MGSGLFECGFDPQPCGVEIDILPPEGQQLIAPCAGMEGKERERVKRMAVESFEQFPRPIRLQDFLFLIRGRRRLNGFAYVVANNAPRLRLSKCAVEYAMNHLHATGRQARAA